MFYLLLVAFSKSQVNDENNSQNWITDRTQPPWFIRMNQNNGKNLDVGNSCASVLNVLYPILLYVSKQS